MTKLLRDLQVGDRVVDKKSRLKTTKIYDKAFNNQRFLCAMNKNALIIPSEEAGLLGLNKHSILSFIYLMIDNKEYHIYLKPNKPKVMGNFYFDLDTDKFDINKAPYGVLGNKDTKLRKVVYIKYVSDYSFIVVDKKHEGYPENSVTLITDRVISNKLFDAPEPNNPIDDRRGYGNNVYGLSNIHQWLNSDKKQWFKKTHNYDEPPNYADESGFLTNFSYGFKKNILKTKIGYLQPTPTSTNSIENFELYLNDLFFLPSVNELGIASNGANEGTKLKLFDDINKLKADLKTHTRSCGKNSIIYQRGVEQNGSFTWYKPNDTGFGVRPLCNLKDTVRVSDKPNSDGAYELIFEPVITWESKSSVKYTEITDKHKTDSNRWDDLPPIIKDGVRGEKRETWEEKHIDGKPTGEVRNRQVKTITTMSPRIITKGTKPSTTWVKKQEEKRIPSKVIERDDPKLARGLKRTEPGQDGRNLVTWEERYYHGNSTGEKRNVQTKELDKMTPTIHYTGTKDPTVTWEKRSRIEYVEIPKEPVEIKDPTIPLDEVVYTEGVRGENLITWEVKLLDGVETSEIINKKTTPQIAMIPKYKKVGTGPAREYWQRLRIELDDGTITYSKPWRLPKDGKDADPLDVERALEPVYKKISTIKNQTDKKIESMVTTDVYNANNELVDKRMSIIEQTEKGNSLKYVEKGKVISEINNDSSGARLSGKKIRLTGDTEVDGSFKVESNGSKYKAILKNGSLYLIDKTQSSDGSKNLTLNPDVNIVYGFAGAGIDSESYSTLLRKNTNYLKESRMKTLAYITNDVYVPSLSPGEIDSSTNRVKIPIPNHIAPDLSVVFYVSFTSLAKEYNIAFRSVYYRNSCIAGFEAEVTVIYGQGRQSARFIPVSVLVLGSH